MDNINRQPLEEQPMVLIQYCGEKISELKAGDKIPLERADTLLRELDEKYQEVWTQQMKEGMKAWQIGSTEVQLQVRFLFRGNPMKYSIKQRLGEGNGSLMDRIQSQTEKSVEQGREMLQEILPHLRTYCGKETPEPVSEVEKEQRLLDLGRKLLEEIKDTILDGYDKGTLQNKEADECRKKLTVLMKYLQEEMGVVGGVFEILERKVIALSQNLLTFSHQEGFAREKLLDDVQDRIMEVGQTLDEVEKMGRYRTHHLGNGLIPTSRVNREAKALLEALRQTQEEIRSSFQKAVDLDLQTYGKVSQITADAIKYSNDIFHFQINKEGKVEAKLEAKLPKGILELNEKYNVDNHHIWYTSAEPERQTSDPAKVQASSVQPLQKPQEQHRQEDREPSLNREYLHLPNLNQDGFQQMKQFLKQKQARFDSETKMWYIKPGSIPFSELKQRGIYSITEFLELPHQGREQFDKMTSFLRANGARYFPQQQKWYLTPESRKEVIRDYLSKQSAVRQSVRSSLERNKQKLEEGTASKSKEGLQKSSVGITR